MNCVSVFLFICGEDDDVFNLYKKFVFTKVREFGNDVEVRVYL